MHELANSKIPKTRLTALASCIAAVFSLAATDAMATTWTVDTCTDNESGDVTTHTGSLRFSVLNAGEGDTIDMSALTCATLSLATGEIAITQNDLTLNGPSTSKLTIQRQVHSVLPFRILHHLGTGTLQINNLTIAHGNEANNSGNAYGGCIYSKGDVNLKQSVVTDCLVQAPGYAAFGGGVFSKGNLSLKYSTLSNNYAKGSGAHGGGAYVGGIFTALGGNVQNNNAYSVNGDILFLDLANGGGVISNAGVLIQSSTISGNSATADSTSYGSFGGLYIRGQNEIATIISSTISHNSAQKYVGGIYSTVPLALESSTVAYNVSGRETTRGATPAVFAPGVTVVANTNATITLESSIIVGNSYGPFATELDFSTAALKSGVTITVVGANNLIPAVGGSAKVPIDTIGFCPHLGPLRNNGGPTATHALLSHSPAIDAGNNVTSEEYDQRGSPSARVSGSAADIGAYEVQQEDIIFNADFSDC